MIGFLISILVAAWLAVTQNLPAEPIFLIATSFLCKWYIITTVLLAVIIMLTMLGVVTVGTAVGGIGGFLASLIGGGAITLLSMLFLMIKRAMLILGAYTLHASLTISQGAYVWNIFYLVLGGLLLLIALKPRSRK